MSEIETKAGETAEAETLESRTKQTEELLDHVQALLEEKESMLRDADAKREEAKQLRDDLVQATVDARLGDDGAKKRAARCQAKAAAAESEAETLERAQAQVCERLVSLQSRVRTAHEVHRAALFEALREETVNIVGLIKAEIEKLLPLFVRANELYLMAPETVRSGLAMELPGWWGALEPASDVMQVAAASDPEVQEYRQRYGPAVTQDRRAVDVDRQVGNVPRPKPEAWPAVRSSV